MELAPTCSSVRVDIALKTYDPIEEHCGCSQTMNPPLPDQGRLKFSVVGCRLEAAGVWVSSPD